MWDGLSRLMGVSGAGLWWDKSEGFRMVFFLPLRFSNLYIYFPTFPRKVVLRLIFVRFYKSGRIYIFGFFMPCSLVVTVTQAKCLKSQEGRLFTRFPTPTVLTWRLSCDVHGTRGPTAEHIRESSSSTVACNFSLASLRSNGTIFSSHTPENASGRVRQLRSFFSDGNGPLRHLRAPLALIPAAAADACCVLPSIILHLSSSTC